MIISPLDQISRYQTLHPLLPAVIEYMHTTDLFTLPVGRHPIQDEQLFVNIDRLPGRSQQQARLECHRRYIDLQYIISGEDTMGWKPQPQCHHPAADYNADKDIQFFNDTPDNWFTVHSGHFSIFFPEDAHAPLVGDDIIHKAVFKLSIT